jgi:PAS domain-containing protein
VSATSIAPAEHRERDTLGSCPVDEPLRMNSEPDLILNTTLVGDAWINAELATNKSAWQLTGYSHAELTMLRAGRDLAADARSERIYADLQRGREMQGKKLLRRKDGRTVSCRYWGVRTTVARLPYFILLLWPETAAAS